MKALILNQNMKETRVLRRILATGNASISRQNHSVSNCSHAHIHTHLPEGCFIMANGFLVSSPVLQEVGIVVMNFGIVR